MHVLTLFFLTCASIPTNAHGRSIIRGMLTKYCKRGEITSHVTIRVRSHESHVTIRVRSRVSHVTIRVRSHESHVTTNAYLMEEC